MNIRLEYVSREAVLAFSDIYCGVCVCVRVCVCLCVCVQMLRETVGNFSRYRIACHELSCHHISLVGDIQL